MRTNKKSERASRAGKGSRNDKRKSPPKRLRLKVGEPWAEKLKVAVEHRDSISKARIAVVMAVCLMIQLLSLTAYGMVTKDQPVLEYTMSTNKVGLMALLIWATGK